jgi:hypothetical protein
LRKILVRLLWACLGAFALALTLYVSPGRRMPDLQSWHEDAFATDSQAGNAGEIDD